MSSKIERVCPICDGLFTVYQSEISKGGGKVCSWECRKEWLRRKVGPLSPRWGGGKIERKCACGETFWVEPGILKRSPNSGMFCSYKCAGVGRSGSNSPRFVGVIERKCRQCGGKIETKPHRIKQGRGIFCSHECNALWQCAHSKKKGTSIEIKLAKELESRGIEFTKQYAVKSARTVADFFVAPNVIIYADGDYWHNRPESRVNDRRQNYELNRLGYRVYRFWEHDINESVSRCVDSMRLEV